MKPSANLFNLLLLIVFASWSFPAISAPGGPETVVTHFQASLLNVMKDAKSLGMAGRYARLELPIKQAFHLPIMARAATRPYWDAATKAQRRDLITAFKRMSISTLATFFDGYNGEVFKPIGIKPGPQGTVMVETEIVSLDGGSHHLAYVTKQFKNRWLIVDVIVDRGISELSVRRSEYNRILKQKGMDGLIHLLNGKADELIAQ